MGNIYKNADKRKRVKPGSKQPDITVEVEVNELETIPEATETAQEPQKATEVVTTPTEPEKPVSESVEAESATVEELLGDIGAGKKPTRRSTTLYLSDAVLTELEKRSKKAKFRSRSEYLDELLMKLFKL